MFVPYTVERDKLGRLIRQRIEQEKQEKQRKKRDKQKLEAENAVQRVLQKRRKQFHLGEQDIFKFQNIGYM